ncbi:MAG TPA: preprotein translocase subunit SecG [Aquificales bacterium]|nr:preprotein translocase subunit SecG [Aquificales bacterium]
MLTTVLLTLLIIVSILLIIAVLLQKGASEFALAFGSNPMDSLFGGTEADTILVKITYFLGGLFLVLSLLLAVVSQKEQNSLLKELKTEQTNTPPATK